jgi:hypothetical protein
MMIRNTNIAWTRQNLQRVFFSYFLSLCFLHEIRVDFSVDRTMFISKFFSCFQKCLKKHGTVSDDDNGDDKDTIDAVDSSSNLLFELHTLQLATNFFSELNQLGRGGFGPVFKVTLLSFY